MAIWANPVQVLLCLTLFGERKWRTTSLSDGQTTNVRFRSVAASQQFITWAAGYGQKRPLGRSNILTTSSKLRTRVFRGTDPVPDAGRLGRSP